MFKIFILSLFILSSILIINNKARADLLTLGLGSFGGGGCGGLAAKQNSACNAALLMLQGA